MNLTYCLFKRNLFLIVCLMAITTACSGKPDVSFEEQFVRKYGLIVDDRLEYRNLVDSICESTRKMSEQFEGYPILVPGWKINNHVEGQIPVVLVHEGAWTGSLNVAFIAEDDSVIVVNADKPNRDFDIDSANAEKFFTPEVYKYFPKKRIEYVRIRLWMALLHELGHLTPPEVILQKLKSDSLTNERVGSER